MRYPASVFILLLVASACTAEEQVRAGEAPAVPPVTKASGNPTEEVAQLERRWAAAMSQGDSVALEQMMGEDLRSIGGTGTINSKQVAVRRTREGFRRAAAEGTRCQEVVDTVDVQAHGDVAIATGQFTTTCTRAGKQDRGRGTFADVAAKRNGRWEFILMTTTDIPAEQSSP